MAERTKPTKRGNSKPNVKKRGSTYTYYLYVTDADGKRRQHSKGGFKTQREAEDARIAAMNAKATGAYVKAEKISVREFLVDEWLPSRLPPALEESTWHSYDQKIRLHVIPYIGNIPLQQLSPVDLNKLYRHLLDAGRRRPNPKRRRSPEVYERAVALRADGLTLRPDSRGAARRVRVRVASSTRTPSLRSSVEVRQRRSTPIRCRVSRLERFATSTPSCTPP